MNIADIIGKRVLGKKLSKKEKDMLAASKSEPKKKNPEKKGPNVVPNMAAAANTLKVTLSEVQRAKSKGSLSFRHGGSVHVGELAKWLKDNPKPKESKKPRGRPKSPISQREISSLGAGQALKRLEQYEADSHDEIQTLMGNSDASPEERKSAVDNWLKGARELLRYEMSVETAKRDAGELITRAEVVGKCRSFLAWHQVGLSDAIRTAVPRIVGLEKPGDVAHIIDPIIRESQALAFDIGTRAGLVPSWLAEAAMNQKPTTPP